MAASERSNYQRGWFWRRAAAFNHRRLVFLDESAVNTAMTPLYGRAPKGERVVDSVPRNYGEQTSLVGALTFRRGLMAVMTLTGAMDTLALEDIYSEGCTEKISSVFNRQRRHVELLDFSVFCNHHLKLQKRHAWGW